MRHGASQFQRIFPLRQVARPSLRVSALVASCVALGVCGMGARPVGAGVNAAGTTPSVPAPAPAVFAPAPTVPPTTAAKAVAKSTRTPTVRRATTTRTKRKATTSRRRAASDSATPTTTRPRELRVTISGAGPVGVAVRDEPDRTAVLVRRIAEGTTVGVRCQVLGGSVADVALGRTSALWDQLTSGGYVSNVYTSAYRAGEVVAGESGVASCSRSSAASPGSASGAGGVTTTTLGSGKVGARTIVTSVG